MSESHPPYGGQPDPNSAPWGPPPGSPVAPGSTPWGPPGSPVAPPGYGQPQQAYPGQPGQPPQFGMPTPPPRKSNRGLVIGLGIGAGVMALLMVCGGTIGYLALDDDEPTPTTVGSSATPDAGTATSAAPQPTPEQPEQPQNNNAVTARSSSDMSAVCEGSPILNAAPYQSPKSAKVFNFSNSPDRPSSWRLESVGYDKPYYARATAWATVSVVGCLTLVPGSEGAGRKCDYKGTDGKTVTINYVSSRYTLAFHNAKTGEKIADGGTVNAPAVRCPSFVAYNKATLKAYASPDDGAIELAVDKFTG
ncbi:hypothetical protein [Micromonospora endolithica]|uniref:Uncharacterized protein n=1 Tax=Micromonospora endolithica TaxID=230091 RepID=A0A3A9ZAP9_9ACTN|nr:hypothetical protein [Micromonospora endolithica]RKN45400.1 hypothetical protein D7223_17495 [Micromonospora endolithica]TWJ22888.1 hypothetical protein JD76_03011 [Micromonospora endolithica]